MAPLALRPTRSLINVIPIPQFLRKLSIDTSFMVQEDICSYILLVEGKNQKINLWSKSFSQSAAPW